MVGLIPISPRRGDFQFGRLGFALMVARQQQHGTGVDLGVLEQTIERQIGHRHAIGRFG